MLTESGKIVEIQGTAEDEPFSKDEYLSLLIKQNYVEFVNDEEDKILFNARIE